MISPLLLTAGFAGHAVGYAFVAGVSGVDSTLLQRDPALAGHQARSAASCPFNPTRSGAVPISSQYPYCGAVDGIPGKQSCPNNYVPAAGDTAHEWTAPGANDIRGPCPGLNTAANHNFLSHDGITTFTELVDMQQNMYGVGYDLAVLLAVLGVGLDGDPVTEKLSIGCDATSRTAAPGLGPELGLDGHNKFEGDTSLTRNDYFLANGDNFSFNQTLFQMMTATTNGNFSRDQLALYRAQRYNQSRATNPQFYYGPKSLLLYGAASFLYELFPSLGNQGPADLPTETSFFYNERLPSNWLSRDTPYSIPLVAEEITAQYQAYPVQFGGNAGLGNFIGFGGDGLSVFNDGMYNGTVQDGICLLYQFATENQPSSLGTVTNLSVATLTWAATKLNPVYTTNLFGCPLNFNND